MLKFKKNEIDKISEQVWFLHDVILGEALG